MSIVDQIIYLYFPLKMKVSKTITILMEIRTPATMYLTKSMMMFTSISARMSSISDQADFALS